MCLAMMVMLSSVPIRTKALGAKGATAFGAPVAAKARRGEPPHSKPMVSAAAVAAPAPFKNSRRSRRAGFGEFMVSGLRRLRGRVNRSADAGISRAAANVAAHCAVDIRIGGRGVLFEQRSGGHDLAGLAVAALRHLQADPRRLH